MKYKLVPSNPTTLRAAPDVTCVGAAVAAEIEEQVAGALKALGRRLGQAMPHDAIQGRGQFGSAMRSGGSSRMIVG